MDPLLEQLSSCLVEMNRKGEMPFIELRLGWMGKRVLAKRVVVDTRDMMYPELTAQRKIVALVEAVTKEIQHANPDD